MTYTMFNGGGGVESDRLPSSPSPIVRDFVPSSGWTEDSNGHYLLVDLPDFKKDEVTLEVNTSGHLTISGERLSSGKRYILRFQQTLTLPPDSDTDRISGDFDGGILYVTVPKHAPVQPPQEETETRKESENKDTPNGSNAAEEHAKGKQETEREEDGRKKNSEVDSFGEETVRRWEKESNNELLVRVMRMVKENKQIVFTALFAFSLGVWVSRKLGSGEHVDASAI